MLGYILLLCFSFVFGVHFPKESISSIEGITQIQHMEFISHSKLLVATTTGQIALIDMENKGNNYCRVVN